MEKKDNKKESAKDFKQMPWIKLYWSDDKSINIEEIEHIREWVLKWHKISIDWTIDMWNTKTTILLEKGEIFELLAFLYWYTNEVIIKRKNNEIKENKSVSFIKNNDTWDYLIKVDTSIKEKWKVFIKLDLLNKMILQNLCENILIKEIKRVNLIELNKDYLISFIKSNFQAEKSTTNNDNIKNDITQEKQKTSTTKSNNSFSITYLNTYNWVEKENIINVDETVYNYFKNLDISKLDEKTIKTLIEKLKKINIDNWKQYFFLNEKNFNTIICKW